MSALARWWRWWRVHLRWWAGDVRLLAKRAVQEFTDDNCPQLAASISYYVLFSIFPLAILVVSIAGLVLTNDSLRERVTDELFSALPLSAGEGRADLERTIENVAQGRSAIGLVSIVGLIWSASGMMGALRHALNEAWDTEFRRPFLRGKAVDVLMVAGVGLLLATSLAATIALQVVRRLSDSFSDWLGPLGVGATGTVEVVAVLVPLALTFLTFMVVFKIVPDVKTRYRYIWPGALVAAVLFEVLKNGFAIYLRNFGNYDAVYGSLAAVIILMFFVYLSSMLVLLGAEIASEWPRVVHGHYDEVRTPGPPDGRSLREKVAGALLRLVRHEEEMPYHVGQPELAEERRRRRRDWVAAELGAEAAAAEPGDEEDEILEPPLEDDPPRSSVGRS